ncbi:exodeoxyribonuclease 7 large subunit [Paenibacillus montaniterrae]|uniref:Exodeoxyribonuclease 7 large subunit n=1 Tax=Paenibacillus montaniterrae TaxID=429341 RepID=A0A919YL50_9BACL|nr:exodeoxyribonuclease VII large subunit [Paenibacillus montaniterrae]GIP15252.1 exodeoxyribonuclease 7 large subunit [Paenibacillus montaniterrae]
MAMQPHIYTIKDINKYIRMKMDSDAVLSDVWLRGEISNFTHHSSGHMYFTLKDKDSRIKCVMFSSHNARLKFVPREGTKVIARGTVSVFERDGAYQFYANMMQPDGLGSLYLAYEQLKAKLEEEGLFAASRKRTLPLFPVTVGVVTSPTGAAVRDIITTIKRRMPSAHILLAPVQVQGELAAPSIVKAITAMNEHCGCDVLIVGRGGGSLEELWAFNEEAVVRAIASSAIPVISAVGHETDFTLSDFAADVRAATPTAAAELAVPHIQELSGIVFRQQEKLTHALRRYIDGRAERLRRVQHNPIFAQPKRYFLQQAERVDYLQLALRNSLQAKLQQNQRKLSQVESKLARLHPEQRIKLLDNRLQHLQQKLNEQMLSGLKHKKMQTGALIKQLDALSPLKVMARGYSLTYTGDGQLLKKVDQAEIGDTVEVKVSDGSLVCKVEEIKDQA